MSHCMPTISVIICTRNRAASLRLTLAALREVVVPESSSVELVIADNGSTDDTRTASESFPNPRMTTRYHYEPRKGQAIARNSGVASSSADIIIFTDDDVRPSPNWLSAHVQAYDDPKVSAVVGRVKLEFDVPPPHWLNRVHRGLLAEVDRGEAVETPHTSHLVGANMSFRRSVWEKLGGFNTLLGPGRAGFWDDSDFSVRLMQAGFVQCYLPDALVHHQIASERLTPEYFRDVAFRSGASAFIAGHIPPDSLPSTGTFLRSRLREHRRRAASIFLRKNSVCPESEIFYVMEKGRRWARRQGMKGLTS